MDHEALFFVVSHADQLTRSDHILVTPIEGSAANGAHEAGNVIDGKPRAHHQVMRQKALATSAALDPKPPLIVPTAQEASLLVVAGMG